MKMLQEHYASLEIDTREKDIVQLWMLETDDPQVIQIERENLKKVIEVLTNCINENENITSSIKNKVV